MTRHGRGWRGHWREGKGKDSKRHSTETYARKGEARAALNHELDRIAQGDGYMPPITLREPADRWLDHTTGRRRQSSVRVGAMYGRWRRSATPRRVDLTTEALQGFLARLPADRVGKAYKRDIVRTLRQVYAFGVEAALVKTDPRNASSVFAPGSSTVWRSRST